MPRAPRIEVYRRRRGLARRPQWGWRFVAVNGKVVAWSEGYNNMADASDAAQLVTTAGPLEHRYLDRE